MYRTEFSLVAWAPSLLDDANDEDECSDFILAITHSEKVEVLSIRTILEQGEENCFIEGITRGKKSIHKGHTQVSFFLPNTNERMILCLKYWIYALFAIACTQSDCAQIQSVLILVRYLCSFEI